MNVTDDLGYFSEERIKVGKEEAGTSAFNQVYDAFQENQDKDRIRQLLEMAGRKVRVRINQWKLVMIIYTDTQNIPAKFWTDSFVAFNLRTHQRLYFSDCIKKIVPDV